MKEKNMTNPANPPVNPFADFEDDFKKAEKAENTTPGRVPPETYKFVLTAQEVPPSSGMMADFEVIVGKNTGTKGFKLFCEILEPESVPNPKTKEPHVTKGAVLDHVFWVTAKNLPYIKRDVATITGRDIDTMGELLKITWAGRTFEGVVRDEEYLGRISSRIAFINPWAPKAEEGANPDGVATGSKDAAKTETKKADPKPDPKAATKSATPAKDAKQPAKTGGVDNSW
jgi:hypothetical protein